MSKVPRVRRIGEPRSDSRTYSVGYGKPPRKNRFQPGHSGNPKGRPKGTKNTTTLLRQVLDSKIELRTGGRPRKISVREGILTRIAERALKGDTKSATFVLQLYDMPDSAQDASVTATEEQEIIDSYLETYLRKRGAQK